MVLKSDNRFQRVYSQGTLTVTEIWVDTVTGINYIFHQSGYGGGMTPLLGPDGKPVVDTSATQRSVPEPNSSGCDYPRFSSMQAISVQPAKGGRSFVGASAGRSLRGISVRIFRACVPMSEGACSVPFRPLFLSSSEGLHVRLAALWHAY